MLPRYKEKFTAVCQEIFEFGLKEHEKREAEIASFFSCLEEATKDNNNAGVKHIHNYIEYKKKVRKFSVRIFASNFDDNEVLDVNTLSTGKRYAGVVIMSIILA